MYEFSNFINDKIKNNNKYRYTKKDVSQLTKNIVNIYNNLDDNIIDS